MGNKTVKKKFPLPLILFGLAALTFLGSWLDAFPGWAVESIYFRYVFPKISSVSGAISDAVPLSLLDVGIVLGLLSLVYLLLGRRWRLLLGSVSFLYLWFFWGWGLNYHRPPLASRLHLETAGLGKADFARFADTAAEEINRLYPGVSSRNAESPLSRADISARAAARVEQVVTRIDGVDWRAATRVKRSRLAEAWYRSAGVDGMFNPYGHEPLVIEGPLPFELPFLMAHEIAHARGVANEGEANLVALLATLMSEDPRFQYSGWMYLWDYLRSTPTARLDDGPRADRAAALGRRLRDRIRIVGNFQASLLDVHLKANAVPGGIRSYSDFVALALASRPRWEEFR